MCTRYLGRVCSLSSHLVLCLMESDIRRVVGELVELPSVDLYVDVGNTDLIFFPSNVFMLPTYTDRMEHIKRGDM